MFTKTQIQIANATSRSNGAVGKNAIVPRIAREHAKPGQSILDFGAGKDALHAKALREAGLDVTAHEFGDNQNENHDRSALGRKYSMVYASNVLNVQESRAMLNTTLSQVFGALKRGGTFIANYPASPRKSELSNKEIKAILGQYGTVKRLKNSTPVFVVTR